MNGAEAYPLHWPEGWKRTNFPKRSRFRVASFAKTRDALFAEVKRLGGSLIVLSTNIPLRLDGLPYASFSPPKDKGVAIYFLRRGRRMSFACDKWDRIEDNMRAIEKTIAALRGSERWGASEMLERAFTAFEALPAPRSPWDILGLRPGAHPDAINAAFRDKARRAHPDTGGSTATMAELNNARSAALRAHG